jgi:2,5-diketo-D-gluconate reductase A
MTSGTNTVPLLRLNNGTTIPQLGFGTLNVPPGRELTPERTRETAEIVGLAFEIGYRHIDTAQSYETERGIGEVIAASDIQREQLYITSKLANGNHRPDDVRRSFAVTMEKLGLDQLDLFLIHWPLPTLYDGDYVSTWQAMVELMSDGRLRSAGVSNFEPAHLDRIIAATGVAPAVNQIEIHPYFANTAAREACARHGIVVEAWSPLGQGNVLADPVIGRIAAERAKSPAQIILRWHLQHGYIVIPKSMHRERIAENFAVFDFELSAEEMAAIDALDRGEDGRSGPHPDTFAWIP